MTMQTLVGGVDYGIPPGLMGVSGTLTASSSLMDASAEYVGFVIQAPKAGAIRKIGFLTATVTTSDSISVGIYNVSTSNGNPNLASAYGGMAVGTQASVASNTAYTVTLGTDCTIVNPGSDIIAVVVHFTSFVAGSVNIATLVGAATTTQFPYGAANGARLSAFPVMWVEWSDGTYTYIPNLLPSVTSGVFTSLSYNTGSALDEVGLAFTLPFKARVAGCGLIGGASASTTYDMILYSGTTSVSSVTFDSDQLGNSANRPQYRRFVTPYEVAANTQYRLIFKPNSATNITLPYFTAPSAAALNQVSGGSNFYYTGRADAGGSWTGDDTNSRPFIWLILDQVDDGASTGGGGGAMTNRIP